MSASGSRPARSRRALAATLSAWLLLPADAQARTQEPAPRGPELHAAFADSSKRGAMPALVWLCEQYLPGLPTWPEGLDPRGPFAVTLSPTGLSIGPTSVALPVGAAVIGTGRLDDSRSDGSAMVFCCDVDGLEQWHVPHTFILPHGWHVLLHAIEGDLLDTPRTLAVPVVAGHLAGSMLDGDPRAVALRLCTAMCGDATWLSWSTKDWLRVRGRSEGGLMLPLALLAIAVTDGGGSPSALSLRAFAARDADRAEAARQLGRDDRATDLDTLRALLSAEDTVRLTAIDALVRHGASEELPLIVEAASPVMPWAILAAEDALRSLWTEASPATRQATRAALHRSQSVALRSIDVDALPGGRTHGSATEPADDAFRARLLLVLFCCAVGLLGLWSRERVRLLPATR